MNKKLMAYVLALINARAELNVYGADGMTPLHAATQTQNLVGLKTLLDGSASPDMVCSPVLLPCGLTATPLQPLATTACNRS
jgi:hypothetical protein